MGLQVSQTSPKINAMDFMDYELAIIPSVFQNTYNCLNVFYLNRVVLFFSSWEPRLLIPSFFIKPFIKRISYLLPKIWMDSSNGSIAVIPIYFYYIIVVLKSIIHRIETAFFNQLLIAVNKARSHHYQSTAPESRFWLHFLKWY